MDDYPPPTATSCWLPTKQRLLIGDEVVVAPARRVKLRDMTRYQKIWAVGVAVYILSFFVPAMGGTRESGGAPGYSCAWYAFVLPLRGFDGYFQSEHLEYFSLLVSGWINPVFIAAAVLALSRKLGRLFVVLRAALVVMIPFCWVVYYKEESYPREGHFLWILGMLLVLFSQRRTKLSEARPHPA